MSKIKLSPPVSLAAGGSIVIDSLLITVPIFGGFFVFGLFVVMRAVLSVVSSVAVLCAFAAV